MMQTRGVASAAGKQATQNARALLLAREREKNRAAMARVRALEEKILAEKRFARKFIDRGGALGKFVKFGMLCREVSTSPLFENTVLFAIMVAGGLVALNTYDGMEESVGAKVVDGIVMTIFGLEIVLKLLAQHVRFWRYFVGDEWRWNVFDFLVFVFSLPVWDVFFDGSFVLALRLMRLMRFMKIIHKIPTLRLIIEGLIGGLSAVTAISLLLFLIFYLYAIVGVTFFGTNDPWHFASFRKAFITLIRCATLEDWSDVMYVNYYGCDIYDNGLYVKSIAEAGIGTHLCESPSAQPLFTVLFFISFITLASFVMLSMFVGAITLSMAGSVELMNQEARMKEERKRLRMERKRRSSAAPSVAAASGGGDAVPVADDWRATNKKRKVAAVLLQAWDGTTHTYEPLPDPRLEGPCSVLRLYIQLGNVCRRIVATKLFSRVILAAIIVAAILVGMETRQNPSEAELAFVSKIQFVVFWVFFIELALNICSFGLEPLRFLFGNPDRHWNRLDFMVVALSIANVGAFIQVVRLLRLLRILRVVRSIPKLRVLVMALVNGVTSIGYISSIMFVTYFVFSILAIIFFKENDPWHFKNLHTAMITLFRCATLEDWTDVMYIQMYGCANYAVPTCTKSRASGYFAALFFVIFVVIGSLVMLNLFVGVISTSMEQAADELEKERLLETEVDQISSQFGVSTEGMAMYREVFGLLDVDGGGSIADEELKLGLEAAGRTVSDNEVKRLVAEFDENEDGNVDFAEFVRFMEIQKQKIAELHGHVPDEGMSVAGALGAGADAATALGKGVLGLGKDIGKLGMGIGKLGLGMGKAGLSAAKKGVAAGVHGVAHTPSDGGASMLSSGSAALHAAMDSTKEAAHKAARVIKASASDAATVLKEDAQDDLGYVRSSSSSSDDDYDDGAGADAAAHTDDGEEEVLNDDASRLPSLQLDQTVNRQLAQFCGAFEEFLHVHCAEHNLDTSGVQDAMLRVLSKEARSAGGRTKTGANAVTSARRASQAKFLKRGLQCNRQ